MLIDFRLMLSSRCFSLHFSVIRGSYQLSSWGIGLKRLPINQAPRRANYTADWLSFTLVESLVDPNSEQKHRGLNKTLTQYSITKRALRQEAWLSPRGQDMSPPLVCGWPGAGWGRGVGSNLSVWKRRVIFHDTKVGTAIIMHQGFSVIFLQDLPTPIYITRNRYSAPPSVSQKFRSKNRIQVLP